MRKKVKKIADEEKTRFIGTFKKEGAEPSLLIAVTNDSLAPLKIISRKPILY